MIQQTATLLALPLHDVVGSLRRAIDSARKNGLPVIVGPMAYTDYADEQLHRKTGINRIILPPHKGNDVFETGLPDQLKRLGITHLVIAGMTANHCCASTGRRASEIGCQAMKSTLNEMQGFDLIF